MTAAAWRRAKLPPLAAALAIACLALLAWSATALADDVAVIPSDPAASDRLPSVRIRPGARCAARLPRDGGHTPATARHDAGGPAAERPGPHSSRRPTPSTTATRCPRPAVAATGGTSAPVSSSPGDTTDEPRQRIEERFLHRLHSRCATGDRSANPLRADARG